MKQCLDEFCNLFSQKVSFEKSSSCVSPDTNVDLVNFIATISGSPLMVYLSKYLVVPLIHSQVSKTTYQEIIEKVQKRLSS